MKVLITGASGFVGRHVLQSLSAGGQEVVSFGRSEGPVFHGTDHIQGDETSDFSSHLSGIDAVVHAAGMAHQSGNPADLRDRFFEVNGEWTRRIAEAIRDSDVQTFVHISSIAAAGVPLDRRSERIRESDEIEPISDYGKSKQKADSLVCEILGDSGKLAVNLRPPLIYGQGTKGNWDKLCRLAQLPVPLPFASVRNRRSYLSIDNLTDFISTVLSRSGEEKLSGTYHLADDEVLSLAEVATAIREGLQRSPALVPFPPKCLETPLRIAGKTAMAEGLFQDLVVDSSLARTTFNWNPPVGTVDGMRKSVRAPEQAL